MYSNKLEISPVDVDFLWVKDRFESLAIWRKSLPTEVVWKNPVLKFFSKTVLFYAIAMDHVSLMTASRGQLPFVWVLECGAIWTKLEEKPIPCYCH